MVAVCSKYASILAVVMLLLASASPSHASATGPYAPSLCVDDARIGSAPWNFPERAQESDNLRTVKAIDHQVTHFLVCTGFNFSIPDTDLITGILVENEVSVGGADELVQDHAQRIVRGGAIAWADRAEAQPWPQVEAILAHGSSVDLWGECWCARPAGGICGDPACGNVNNTDFGAALAASHTTGSGGSARVDQVRITVYHAVPTPTMTGTPTPTITATWTPSPTPTATASIAVCPASPAIGCAAPGKASLRLTDNSNPSARKFKWRWQRGTMQTGELGDPLRDTSYALCVYDDETLLAELVVFSSGVCGHAPCWKSLRGGGFAYRNSDTNENGIATAVLRVGAGTAAIEVKAKRGNLTFPMPIRQTDAVTVQLVKNLGSGLQCWTSRFVAPAQRSTHDNFEDALGRP